MNSENNNINVNNNTNTNTNVNLNPTNGGINQNVQNTPNLGNVGQNASNFAGGQVPANQYNMNAGNNSNVSPSVLPSNASNVSGTQITNSSVSTPGVATENLTVPGGDGSIVNEKLKEVEINYTPPSKFKTVMTIIMFILIIAFVIFLPDITGMISQYKLNKDKAPETVITTGQLECTLKSNTTNLDMEYFRIFKFTDSLLYEANYTLTTKGDATLDEKTLDEMAEKCNHLSDSTKDLSGVTISCNYSDGKLVEKQNYIFASINNKNLDAAFAEAGGTYPEFRDGQEIDSIEKTMNAAGYTCVRREK